MVVFGAIKAGNLENCTSAYNAPVIIWFTKQCKLSIWTVKIFGTSKTSKRYSNATLTALMNSVLGVYS